jgi:hypothetical protein
MLTIIGVDPGVTTGIAVLDYSEIINARDPKVLQLIATPELYQCQPMGAIRLVRTMFDAQLYAGAYATIVLSIERFIEGKHSNTAEGNATREVVGILTALAEGYGQLVSAVHTNRAADVKPWATDRRLEAAGVPDPKGFRHARDAARHALYAGVRAHNVPDPLSSQHSRKAGS